MLFVYSAKLAQKQQQQHSKHLETYMNATTTRPCQVEGRKKKKKKKLSKGGRGVVALREKKMLFLVFCLAAASINLSLIHI